MEHSNSLSFMINTLIIFSIIYFSCSIFVRLVYFGFFVSELKKDKDFYAFIYVAKTVRSVFFLFVFIYLLCNIGY